MELKRKWCWSFLAFAFQFCILEAEPISIVIDNRSDYEVLDQFFKMGVSEEGYGYVLDGVKPIAIRDFYPLDQFPIAKDLAYAEREFTNTLLVCKAISVWKKVCSNQQNFVLKVIPTNVSGVMTTGFEVQFINIPKLKAVIENNIDLIRYVLGPGTDPDQLMHRIAYSQEKLADILHDDLALMGIVLGFGSHNSIVGGRIDSIQALSISRDQAPFRPKASLMQSKDHSLNFLAPQRYGCYYLEFAGGDDSCFRTNFSRMPVQNFSNVVEELRFLSATEEALPQSLRERPAFIFAAFKKGPSNQPLFERLQRVQAQTKALLKTPKILDALLEQIGGKKPKISFDQSVNSSSAQIFPRATQQWMDILREVLARFEDESRKKAFVEAFIKPSSSSRKAPTMIGVSTKTLVGLEKALHNLAEANQHFETLSRDQSFQMLSPLRLYFKTTAAGSGKKLHTQNLVRLGYIIEDPEGNVLFANHDTWLDLSQTISGFANGVQGMQVDEKRAILIHPSLAYGALTTLPPCTELTIKTHLLDIDEKSSAPLPPLETIDLTWLADSKFRHAIEESIQQQPRFAGSFYRTILDKAPGADKSAIIAELRKL
ncbi:MAG: FKBP-type peptidyl-prolyl cis-trans isomerase [Chlamydiales bacterium]